MNKIASFLPIYFISGHLDLTDEEFEKHYVPQLEAAHTNLGSFVVGDARGADAKAQAWLKENDADCTVYHMFDNPRNNAGFPTEGGFFNDAERDRAMTKESDADIAWVRPGRERSGTARNLRRRHTMARTPSRS